MRVVGLLFLFLMLTSIAQSENQSYQIKSSPALQFMSKLFDTVQRVSPKQKGLFVEYEKEMKALGKKLHKLDREIYKANAKGLKGKAAATAFKKEVKLVMNDALAKTETYLAQLSIALKKERNNIIDDLLPSDWK
jgi:hypothetical protein